MRNNIALIMRRPNWATTDLKLCLWRSHNISCPPTAAAQTLAAQSQKHFEVVANDDAPRLWSTISRVRAQFSLSLSLSLSLLWCFATRTTHFVCISLSPRLCPWCSDQIGLEKLFAKVRAKS